MYKWLNILNSCFFMLTGCTHMFRFCRSNLLLHIIVGKTSRLKFFYWCWVLCLCTVQTVLKTHYWILTDLIGPNLVSAHHLTLESDWTRLDSASGYAPLYELHPLTNHSFFTVPLFDCHCFLNHIKCIDPDPNDPPIPKLKNLLYYTINNYLFFTFIFIISMVPNICALSM